MKTNFVAKAIHMELRHTMAYIDRCEETDDALIAYPETSTQAKNIIENLTSAFYALNNDGGSILITLAKGMDPAFCKECGYSRFQITAIATMKSSIKLTAKEIINSDTITTIATCNCCGTQELI